MILPYNQTGDLEMRSNGQSPLNSFESMGICDGMPWNVFQFSFYKQLKFRAQLS